MTTVFGLLIAIYHLPFKCKLKEPKAYRVDVPEEEIDGLNWTEVSSGIVAEINIF